MSRYESANQYHGRITHSSRALAALTACLLMGVAIITFACGGGGAKEAPVGPTGTPFVTPAAGLPQVPPDVAEKAGLLIYRDSVAAKVFAVNLANGERHPVPAISPLVFPSLTAFDCTRDGRLIAYANSAAEGRITVVSFAGEGARSQPVEVRGAIQSMAWAPGGDRIAMALLNENRFQLAILDVNSGVTTTLTLDQSGATPTPNFLPFTPVPGLPASPRWSPDASRLAISIEGSGRSDIYVVDVASLTMAQVSTRPAAFTPDWSPDGRTLIFVAGDDQGGNPQLYAVEADGTNERKVTASETQKSSPRWSLDGSLIAYGGLTILPTVNSRPALLHNQAVWVAAADGTQETPVTELALDALPLAWCMRGAWLG